MTKNKTSLFVWYKRVTPTVTAPGDTNLSEATEELVYGIVPNRIIHLYTEYIEQ